MPVEVSGHDARKKSRSVNMTERLRRLHGADCCGYVLLSVDTIPRLFVLDIIRASENPPAGAGDIDCVPARTAEDDVPVVLVPICPARPNFRTLPGVNYIVT